jgi:hypothetical protein
MSFYCIIYSYQLGIEKLEFFSNMPVGNVSHGNKFNNRAKKEVATKY